MDFKLVWTESAIEDLGAIVRYLTSQAGSEIAGKIGFEIYDRIQILSSFPESGSILLEKGVPEWRKLIVRTWKVAYRIEFDFAHGLYRSCLARIS